MKLAIAFAVVFFLAAAIEAESPSNGNFERQDPSMADIYKRQNKHIDRHRHNNDGSNRLWDVYPDSASHYVIGSTYTRWAEGHFSSITLNGFFQPGQFTAAQLRALQPTATGQIVFNLTDYDLYASTGSSAPGSWRNVRTQAGP